MSHRPPTDALHPEGDAEATHNRRTPKPTPTLILMADIVRSLGVFPSRPPTNSSCDARGICLFFFLFGGCFFFVFFLVAILFCSIVSFPFFLFLLSGWNGGKSALNVIRVNAGDRSINPFAGEFIKFERITRSLAQSSHMIQWVLLG